MVNRTANCFSSGTSLLTGQRSDWIWGHGGKNVVPLSGKSPTCGVQTLAGIFSASVFQSPAGVLIRLLHDDAGFLANLGNDPTAPLLCWPSLCSA